MSKATVEKKAAHFSDNKRYEVQVEYSVVVLHVVPVTAVDEGAAKLRAVGIVKAGNTRAVGGRKGQDMWRYEVKTIRRRTAV